MYLQPDALTNDPEIPVMKVLNILFLTATAIFGKCICDTIEFERCGYNGFTCKNSKLVSGQQEITYQCNKEDVAINLWRLLLPATSRTLLITKCSTLRLTFDCATETWGFPLPMKVLHVQNVANLQLMSASLPHNPPTIIFENISNIETIPRGTFSQIKDKKFKPLCLNSDLDLDTIIFQNVKIGTIEWEAFDNLTNMKFFLWRNVSVVEIKRGALKIALEGDSVMQIRNSDIAILKTEAIQVNAKALAILDTKFLEMFSGSLSGTVNNFLFSYNTVNNVHSGAFSLLAQEVDFLGNHFEYLHSAALQKISPGRLENPAMIFQTPKFSYSFRQNLIKRIDTGGLHPDIAAYKNSSANITFVNNSIYCTCEGLAWLGTGVHLGPGYSDQKDFHEIVMNSENNNTCAFLPCTLSLEAARKFVVTSSKCEDSAFANAAKLCQLNSEPSSSVCYRASRVAVLMILILCL